MRSSSSSKLGASRSSCHCEEGGATASPHWPKSSSSSSDGVVVEGVEE